MNNKIKHKMTIMNPEDLYIIRTHYDEGFDDLEGTFSVSLERIIAMEVFNKPENRIVITPRDWGGNNDDFLDVKTLTVHTSEMGDFCLSDYLDWKSDGKKIERNSSIFKLIPDLSEMLDDYGI